MKKTVALLVLVSLATGCFADTFTNLQSGETFDGYCTNLKKGNKTKVYTDKGQSVYLDLYQYQIQRNYRGRKNHIVLLEIKTPIEIDRETNAFEKAINAAANQGPLFILIEIDTPGGRIDLTKRICSAITQADNCDTIALVTGGKFGGAYSAGAMIALACDYIYMEDETAIGAATPIVISSSGIKDLKEEYGETVGEKFLSAQRAYLAALAEQNGRPTVLAKAMVDKDIEAVEVVENDKTYFTERKNRKSKTTIKHTWSKRGSLLTLTANQAVQCGMADEIIQSQQELIKYLGLENPKIIADRNTAKAKREFEVAEKKKDKTINKIDLYVKEVERLTNLANSVTDEYNTVIKGNYSNRKKVLKQLMAERQRILRSLAKTSNKLITEYNSLIKLGDKYPSLNIDAEEIKKAINSVKVQLAQINDVYE